jgi:hypothetical protein
VAALHDTVWRIRRLHVMQVLARVQRLARDFVNGGKAAMSAEALGHVQSALQDGCLDKGDALALTARLVIACPKALLVACEDQAVQTWAPAVALGVRETGCDSSEGCGEEVGSVAAPRKRQRLAGIASSQDGRGVEPCDDDTLRQLARRTVTLPSAAKALLQTSNARVTALELDCVEHLVDQHNGAACKVFWDSLPNVAASLGSVADALEVRSECDLRPGVGYCKAVGAGFAVFAARNLCRAMQSPKCVDGGLVFHSARQREAGAVARAALVDAQDRWTRACLPAGVGLLSPMQVMDRQVDGLVWPGLPSP